MGLEISGPRQKLGSAIPNGSGFCLTSGPGQTGALFHSAAIPQAQSFRCALAFRMVAPPGSGAADGIAIVFSPEIKLGLSGFGLGYSGLGGKGDFAVESESLDTGYR